MLFTVQARLQHQNLSTKAPCTKITGLDKAIAFLLHIRLYDG